jgi:hypothetical protein
MLATSAAGAVLLGGVGAFGTGSAAPWTLYSYWLVLMLAAALASSYMTEVLDARRLFADSLAKRAVALTLCLTVGGTPLVWLMAALMLNGSWRAARMIVLAPQVLLVAAALAGLQLLLERRRTPLVVAEPGLTAARPALLRRLPGRLAGAELHAIEAEDHYLRFHTDKGSALLLMRLGDAMAGLEGLEGARTHRSW